MNRSALAGESILGCPHHRWAWLIEVVSCRALAGPGPLPKKIGASDTRTVSRSHNAGVFLRSRCFVSRVLSSPNIMTDQG